MRVTRKWLKRSLERCALFCGSGVDDATAGIRTYAFGGYKGAGGTGWVGPVVLPICEAHREKYVAHNKISDGHLMLEPFDLAASAKVLEIPVNEAGKMTLRRRRVVVEVE